MTHDSISSRPLSWVTVAIVTLLAIPVLYIGSFAPAYRFSAKRTKPRVQRFYGPVFSLMEQTPLRTPLLAWCDIWGCQDEVNKTLRNREMRTWFDGDSPASR